MQMKLLSFKNLTKYNKKTVANNKIKKRPAHTCKHSAAFKKLERLSCETCTSPLYINSSNADILLEDVPSRMTSTLGQCGAASNKS